MVETLEHLIRQLSEHPRNSRAPLCKELLRSETFLLTVDQPLEEDQVTRVTGPDESFPIWADKDSELGGVWVPVFPARDAVAEYVKRRKLKAPKGKEFLWMEHQPGAVFPLLRGVSCFAGIRLSLGDGPCIELAWPEVMALAEGRIPPDAPRVYDLPLSKLVLPAGVRLAFGRVGLGPEGEGRLLCIPDAGRFKPDDLRRLVRLPFGDETVWMACRHFLQALRFLHTLQSDPPERYVEDLLRALLGFQMYGEGEALCHWLAAKGREAYAWLALSAIYGKTGRLDECAELCRRAAGRYPAEAAFAVTGAKALAKLGRRDEAMRLVAEALERKPGDQRLKKCLGELSA